MQYQYYYGTTTVPHQAGQQHTVPQLLEISQNIWIQAVSILVERTINQSTEVLLFFAISIEPGSLLVILKPSDLICFGPILRWTQV